MENPSLSLSNYSKPPELQQFIHTVLSKINVGKPSTEKKINSIILDVFNHGEVSYGFKFSPDI